MPKINILLKDKNQKINIKEIENKYSWIYEKSMDCIISPDSDGLMCGLLMSQYFDWKIKGFYDGKVLLYQKDIDPKNCIFLDMEIARKNVKSVGQHLITPCNKIYKEYGNNVFENCLSPNLLRNYDQKNNFQLKFPMATVHFLISILCNKIDINLSKKSIYPLLFVDGLYNVLFNYPENVMNWFNFLEINKENNPLHKILFTEKHSIANIMQGMDSFFAKRNEFGTKSRRDRGDRLVISDNKSAINLKQSGDFYDINEDNANRIKKFINFLSKQLEWEFKKDDWTFKNFKKSEFEKHKLESSPGVSKDKRLINENRINLYKKKCLSLAATAGNRVEYTLIGENKELFE